MGGSPFLHTPPPTTPHHQRLLFVGKVITGKKLEAGLLLWNHLHIQGCGLSRRSRGCAGLNYTLPVYTAWLHRLCTRSLVSPTACPSSWTASSAGPSADLPVPPSPQIFLPKLAATCLSPNSRRQNVFISKPWVVALGVESLCLSRGTK